MSGWGHTVAVATALAAVGVGARVLARWLRVEGTVRIALAVGVLAAAQIVLTVEGLSLLGSIRLLPLLAGHAAVAAVLVRGVPRPTGLAGGLRALWVQADVPLRALGGLTALSAVVLMLGAVVVPVRHDDSLSYHLPRVAIAIQQGSLDAFPTPDLRQTALPANAEILILWQMVLSGRNGGAALLQVLCWVGTTLAVFRLARDLGAPLRPAAFASLAFASFPAVVLQATTAQNDLTAAFFGTCALLFGRSGLAGGRRGDLAIAGAALGLALGTKTTAVLMVPALAFLAVAESVRARCLLAREAALLAACCSAGFLSLGSYVYIQNARRYGHVTGSPAFADLHAPAHLEARVLWSNLVRIGIRLSEPAGLVPPGTRPADRLEQAHARFAEATRTAMRVEARIPEDFMKGQGSEVAGLPLDADLVTFGPLFALTGVPVLLLCALRRRVDPAVRALAWGALVYLVGTSALLRYNVFLGRFLVGMVATVAPLLAVLYRRGAGRWDRLVNGALALTCCATLALCVAVRGATPLLRSFGSPPDPAGVGRPDRPEAEVAARLLARLPMGSVALVPQGVGDLVYPLFDGAFTRVVRMVRASDPGAAGLVERSDYVLVWAESQHQIAEGEPLAGAWPWFGVSDLRPLLAALRQPGSGWHPVLDAPLYPPGSFHLFARRPLTARERAALPGLLPASPPLPRDRVRATRFAVPVLVDPAQPATLVVRGEPLPGVPLAIDVSGPGGEPLLHAAPTAPFEARVPLAGLPTSRAPYVVLTFRSTAPWRDRGLEIAGP
jgi:hypothetical protein